MYLCAHLFTGILLGLVFCRTFRDRRLLYACIAGSLLPDLLDKPLSLLLPGIFGSTRTLGHSLLFAAMLLIAALLLVLCRRDILALAFAGLVLVHQILDMLWTVPVTWFFPLYGWFARVPLSGGLWGFLWLELSTLSEWLFALASCVLIFRYAGLSTRMHQVAPGRTAALLQYGTAGLLGITGLFIISTGTEPSGLLIFGLSAEPDKTLMAGLAAVCGAAAMVVLAMKGWSGSGGG